jgi:hypothetical protein
MADRPAGSGPAPEGHPGGDPGDDEVVERFRPTSGRIMGSIGLAGVAVVAGIAVADPGSVPAPVLWGFLFFGALVWTAMLRPRLLATRSWLVMRNMLSTVSIPLAAVEQIVVRQVVAVRVGERRYVSPAVGRTWRQNLRANRQGAETDPATQSYPTFVENRLHQLAEDARAREGVAMLSDEQLALAGGVRREWSWPAVGLVVVTFVGFVVSILL